MAEMAIEPPTIITSTTSTARSASAVASTRSATCEFSAHAGEEYRAIG